MFSARGVALNVTTASVQLRVLHTSVYLSARLMLRGTNSSTNFNLRNILIFYFKVAEIVELSPIKEFILKP
jgi:hypothetical protein